MTFAAVIFDLDGTLIDTETLSMNSSRIAFEAHGLPVTDRLLHSLIGKDKVAGSSILRAEYGDIDLPALFETWVEVAREHFETEIPLKPGVEELLTWLAERDLPRAICTSSSQAEADQKLRITGLGRWIKTVVTVDCITNAKPHPEPYLEAARRLRVSPEICLAFEDSETGAQAAFAAGMHVIQVPDIIPASGKFAHIVADSLLLGAHQAGLLPAPCES
ncbi:HAD family hydrolase [Primorskyibacter flagellatus]|uniref:HAD family hydrolase n=1 Tax=Primorskyibacter flagellatus TaxID=1387277 RepID=UPI003A93F8CF